MSDSLQNQNIICFAGEDWWFHNPHSNLHLMESFAGQNNRVLFVNSTGIKMPDFKADRFFWKRVGNKLKSFLRYLKKAGPNIYVFTPFAFPLMNKGASVIAAVNKVLLILQLRAVIFILKLDRPIIWVTVPVARDIALYLKKTVGRCLVYYCVDNVSHFPGVNREYILNLEKDIQSQAELSLFVNRQLAEERKDFGKNIRLLSHGVDYAHFARAQQGGLPVPDDIKNLPRPIIGYIGEIKPLDFELVRYLAGRHPGFSFVFIGDIYAELGGLRLPANVHFLGKKPYAALPNYLQLFDCCCLYYKVDDTFNNYRNPKKLMEYLATGKPVVSVTILQISEFRDCLHIAGSYEEFDVLLSRALREDSAQQKEQRIRLARAHTWDAVAAEAGGMIGEILRQNENGSPLK